MYARQPLFVEYRRKVAELKKKYGLPPDEEQKTHTLADEDREDYSFASVGLSAALGAALSRCLWPG